LVPPIRRNDGATWRGDVDEADRDLPADEIRGGKIRILAVNAPERLEALPDIPTTDEAGLPNFVSQTFFGLFGPSGTPKAALERIDQATQTAWSDADFRKRLVEAGFEPMLGFGPDKADAYLKQEIARWSPIVQKVGSQTQ
jgi:tripartite-type tricarboxylate transporter receptor subunit TctC